MKNDMLKTQQQELAAALRDKTILVNGATGMIGSRIVYYLIDLNRQHRANIKILCSYRSESKKDVVYSGVKDGNIVFLPTPESKSPVYDEKIDYVIQAAGISGGSKMHLKDPVKIFEASYEATKCLLDFAILHNASKFLFVSTYEIYGAISSDNLIKESDACMLDPMILRNSYAECKRVCESLCVAYSSKFGIETFSGRLTSTFGTGVKYDDPRFFAEFARCVIENKNIVLKSTGGTVRNYLDADDAASAFLYILTNGESCNAYNLTNMENRVSIRDIAEKLIAIGGNKIKLLFDIADDATKLGYRKEGCTVVDATKLEELGWKPVYSLEDTLEKFLDSMKENK